MKILSATSNVVTFAVLFIVIFATTIFGQTANEIQSLPINSLELEIKGGETHRYKINLKSGEFVRVRVEQHGVDVVVRLLAPDGKL